MKILFGLLLPISMAWGAQVQRSAWEQHMLGMMPFYLCANDTYMMKCFQTNTQECEKIITQETQQCLNQARIPASFNADKEGLGYGKQIGICVGKSVEQKWKSKKKKEASCLNR